MKVKVNKEACIGCGACVAICEDVFELNDEGLSQVKVPEVKEDLHDKAQEAVESCPTEAIVEVSEETQAEENKKEG